MRPALFPLAIQLPGLAWRRGMRRVIACILLTFGTVSPVLIAPAPHARAEEPSASAAGESAPVSASIAGPVAGAAPAEQVTEKLDATFQSLLNPNPLPFNLQAPPKYLIPLKPENDPSRPGFLARMEEGRLPHQAAMVKSRFLCRFGLGEQIARDYLRDHPQDAEMWMELVYLLTDELRVLDGVAVSYHRTTPPLVERTDPRYGQYLLTNSFPGDRLSALLAWQTHRASPRANAFREAIRAAREVVREPADRALLDAYDAMLDGQADRLIAACSEALRHNPGHTRTLLLLAESLLSLGEVKPVDEMLTRLEKDQELWPAAFRMRLTYYMRVTGQMPAAQVDPAIPFRYSFHPLIALPFSILAIQNQRLDAAELLTRTAFLQAADCSDGWIHRALIAQQLRRKEETFDCLEHAWRMDPNYARAQKCLAAVRLTQGEPEAALELLVQSSESPVGHFDREVWMQMRGIAQQLNQPELIQQAQTQWHRTEILSQELDKLLPEWNSAAMQARFAEQALNFEEVELAESAFRLAVHFDPEHGPALAGLAEIALRRGDPDEALTRIEAALSQQRMPRLYGIRGEVHLAQGRYDDALTDFRRARRVDPDYVAALKGRAAEHRAAGRNAEAEADEQEAVRIESELDTPVQQAADKQGEGGGIDLLKIRR